ncbi:hypothetical protein C8R47DRAFT_1295007 [Mycena vitilis]|nr:hypothetical protein C8R47DRAFT_1295007 [Mycena vitilis]
MASARTLTPPPILRIWRTARPTIDCIETSPPWFNDDQLVILFAFRPQKVAPRTDRFYVDEVNLARLRVQCTQRAHAWRSGLQERRAPVGASWRLMSERSAAALAPVVTTQVNAMQDYFTHASNAHFHRAELAHIRELRDYHKEQKWKISNMHLPDEHSYKSSFRLGREELAVAAPPDPDLPTADEAVGSDSPAMASSFPVMGKATVSVPATVQVNDADATAIIPTSSGRTKGYGFPSENAIPHVAAPRSARDSSTMTWGFQSPISLDVPKF